jgi:hypothetical protein
VVRAGELGRRRHIKEHIFEVAGCAEIPEALGEAFDMVF